MVRQIIQPAIGAPAARRRAGMRRARIGFTRRGVASWTGDGACRHALSEPRPCAPQRQGCVARPAAKLAIEHLSGFGSNLHEPRAHIPDQSVASSRQVEGDVGEELPCCQRRPCSLRRPTAALQAPSCA